MHRYIWLVPLLPLAGAAINGLLGRKFRFSEKLIGGIAVGSIALSFLITARRRLFLRLQQSRHLARALRHQPGRRFQFRLDSGRRGAA